MFRIPSLGKLKCNLYKCYHYFPNSDFKNFDSHIFRSLAVFSYSLSSVSDSSFAALPEPQYKGTHLF
uniref:Uncharacterized protein n=1 Tax=Siphoviridae sp. ctzO58 TaxID=2825748 RepID=A0A8S5UX10_9CAUD|nr:MAG TPA: hypothetical protein [Siphoviridae sp. ctzO58]